MEKVIDTTFDQLEEGGWPSVTDFCRYLVSTDGKFEGIKIHVYRGDMLCLIVNDIYEAAKFQPSSSGFVKYNPPPSKKRQDKAYAIV